MVPEPVYVAPSADWSGLYVGLQGGYQWHQDEFADPIVPYTGDFDFGGGIVGGHIGYDHQAGNLVYGIVGDFEYAGGSGSGPSVDRTDLVFARAEANWQGSLRARVGYAKDEYLIYATGGLAFANYDFDYTCCGLGFGIGDQFDETLLGGTVGGGVARQLHDGWVTWVDYRYTAYEEASSGIVNCCAPAPNSQDHEMDTHAVRVGLSRQLN